MDATATKGASVKVYEVIKITPFIPSTSTTEEYHLPLTLFDTFWLKFLPVERLFFYEIPGRLNSDLFNSQILPKLKQSLSLILGLHYLPLAGHITWSDAKPAVCYNPNQNDGVSFTVAEYSSTGSDGEDLLFDHLCGDGIREAVEYHPLVPQLSITDDRAEVVAVQVTLFPNRGFCIGISNHHAFFDGASTLMFFKSWASLCKQLSQSQEDINSPSLSLSPELLPSFDRTVIKDPKGIDMVYVKNWIDFTGGHRSLRVLPSLTELTKLVRATFLLTRGDIQKLRDKVLSEYNINKKLHLSAFVITCAYVYSCLVKSRGGNIDRDVVAAFTADYRARLDPPVPKNYFGNCVGPCFKVVKASEFMQPTGSVAFVARTLSEMIEEIGDEISTLDDEFEDRFVKLCSTFRHVTERGGQALSVSGSVRFDVYGSDFGWGRPKKVEIVSIETTGAIALAESRDGDGGVEVGVVLDKYEMENFASLFQQSLN